MVRHKSTRPILEQSSRDRPILEQSSRELEDQGILQDISEKIERYFPDSKELLKTPDGFLMNIQSGIRCELERLGENYGGLEDALSNAPVAVRKSILTMLDFLKKSHYGETPLEKVNNALNTARKQCETDINRYEILKDLGDGVYNTWYFHNPNNPKDWGNSSNNHIMEHYRKSLPEALEKHRIQVREITLALLLELPYNGAQAAELVKFTIDQLETREDGVRTEPQSKIYEALKGVEDQEEFFKLLNVLKSQVLPDSLLKFAKEREYHNAERIERQFLIF